MKPLLPPDRQLWIMAREDAYIASDLVEAQWNAWGRPELAWIPGGHMTFPLFLGRHASSNTLREFPTPDFLRPLTIYLVDLRGDGDGLDASHRGSRAKAVWPRKRWADYGGSDARPDGVLARGCAGASSLRIHPTASDWTLTAARTNGIHQPRCAVRSLITRRFPSWPEAPAIARAAWAAQRRIGGGLHLQRPHRMPTSSLSAFRWVWRESHL